MARYPRVPHRSLSWAGGTESHIRQRRRKRKAPKLECAMCSKVSQVLFGDSSLRMRVCASCWEQLRGSANAPIIKRLRSRKRHDSIADETNGR
jgi:hypothetical protein